MPIIKIPTVFNIDLEFEAADLGRRAVAYLIDLLIRGAYLLLMSLFLGKIGAEGYFAVTIFIGAPIVFYYLISELAMKGQSLGKRVMDIRVVSLMGNVPSASQIVLRWMFRLVESPLFTLLCVFALAGLSDAWGAMIILLMGIVPVVVVLRNPYNQRLGDLAAGTILVRTKERHTIQDTIFREVHQPDYTPQFSQILRLSDRDLSKIKTVLDTVARTGDPSMAERISLRIKEVLHIETDMEAIPFLETLLNDYNYLVTRK
ncbi:RDD family protein [Chitinophaga sp. GCM10012297]|uniref:RDD family protein n=1 Tax=Chitinophaga chungangae TaxID=2821488 RepID=A0ABS3YEH4_9BACT|nr:RDD family protein [Chitinophaga chungangae]MBO9153086.1 RDD family protein [Chitinophaga chungangae]